MGKKRAQAYTEEFRREAVKRPAKPGATTASVARDLGVSAQQIYNWRRQFNRLAALALGTLAPLVVILTCAAGGIAGSGWLRAQGK
ncbi:transposase [Microbulbifer guangxiensis]|uniref:transposase n=1 Tax=Microbulbifer guangxiensis TaxID=2904249 RepID=UPI001F3707F4|nr:transposase [Microbulbifer guangxiensis]